MPRNEIRGEGVRVRRYAFSDVNALHAAVRESIAELLPWLPWCTNTYSKRESESWIQFNEAAWEKNHEYNLVVTDDAGELLGGCGLNAIDWANRRANLGYWVRTSRAREGVATKATRLVAELAFDDLKLRRIEIVAAVGNLASQRVAERAGAVREGIARNRLQLYGADHDAIVYSLIPPTP